MRRMWHASRMHLGLGRQDWLEFLVLREVSQGAWQKEKNVNTSVARVTMLVLALCAGQALAARCYVTPAATGDGSGDSWANAKTNIQAAIDTVYVAGGGEVWLAQGLYYPQASLVLSNTVALLGGFPGVSEAETLDDRDVDTYRTVISGDINRDDIWERFDPMGSETGTFADRGPVISGGALAIPANESARDTFSPKDTKLADNLWRVFDLAVPPLNATAVLDGLWVVSGGRGNRTTVVKSGTRELYYGGAVYVGANSTPTIRNCRFVGCHAYYGTVYYDDNRSSLDFPVFENNLMQFNRAANRGGLKTRANNLTVKGCSFIGNYRTTGSGSGCIFFWSGTKAVITNCYFARNYTTQGAYSSAACISAEAATFPLIVGCVFTNNVAKGLYGKGAAAAIGCENVSNTRIRDSLFVDNYSYIKATADDLSGPGAISAYRWGTFIENCTFMSNVVEGVNTVAGKTVSLAPVLVMAGHQYSTDAFAYVLNCTFRDNQVRVTHTTASNLVYRSRAVLCHANRLSSYRAQVGIANCTFAGSTPGSDLVWAGLITDYPSTVINSVFWSDADDYAPLRAFTPGLIVARNTIAKGFETLPTDIIAERVTADDPLLAPLAIDAGGFSPTHRIGAQVPGVTNGLNVLTYANGSERHACYEVSPGVLTNLVPLVNRAIPALRELLGDANNQSRATNAFTQGAVQTLTPAAVSGHTLTLRARPVSGGGFTGGYPVQVVQPGYGIDPVTAVSATGFDFAQWEDEGGAPAGATATLSLSSLASNILLYAAFTAEPVVWTFDLGAGAAFDAGGHAVTNLTCYPGDPAPAVPAFTVDEEHYRFDGWDPAIPIVVGTENQTFNAQYTEKIFRIVRVAPTVEGGDDSGSSWANAKTNLQAAIDLAGIWQGEVWLKTGIHRTTGNLSLRNHVAVRGGFAGIEGETLSDRDPAACPSVISGDALGNDCWADHTGAAILVGGEVLKVWQPDGSYAPPNPDGADLYWQLGNSTDNADRLFDHSLAGLDQTAVLDGVALSGAKGGEGGVMYNGTFAHPLLTNCVVVANRAGVRLVSWMVFRDCRLLGNTGGAVFMTSGDWPQWAEFHDCVFDGNSTGNRGAAIASNNPGVSIRRSRFIRNYASLKDYGPASAVGMENGKLFLRDSEFIGNFANGSVATVWAASGGSISNCLFVGNRAVRSGTTGAQMLSSGLYASSDTYVDACSFVSNSASLTMTDGSQHGAASAVAYVSHRPRLINCTFHANTAAASTSGDPAQTVAGTVIAFNSDTYGFLAHCSFSENTAAHGDFVLLNPSSTRSQNVFNSIFWNSAPGYVPISRIGSGQFAIFQSTVKGWETIPAWVTTATAVSTLNPQFARLQAVNGRFVLPLGGFSPVRRGGLDILLDTAGVHVYDSAADSGTPVYKRCDDLTARTPTQPALQIPDALGTLRVSGKISQGAVQSSGGSTLLILR